MRRARRRLTLVGLLLSAACASGFVAQVRGPSRVGAQVCSPRIPTSVCVASSDDTEGFPPASSLDVPPSGPLARRQERIQARRESLSRGDMLRRAAPLSALLAVGLSGVGRARASDYYKKVPGKMEYALDFVKQLKIEVMGASDEFEKLNDGEKSKLLEEISPFGAEKAYVALGCYWGAEATFRCTKGVVGTRVGFMGGKEPDPYYENIKDHIEAIEVTYTGGDETYRRILRVCGRTFDFEDIGPRYARRIWASSPGQKKLATLKGEIWSNMAVRDAADTFFTAAKMDHQAYSKPKCAALAAPNVALVEAGLRRKVDHLHYASDCPTCTLRGEVVALDDEDFVSDPSTLSPPPRALTPAASSAV